MRPLLYFAANGFLPSLGVQRRRLMPMTLTASLTRSLTQAERQAIGEPSDWGVLAAHGMGATVRYTEDHRILMRNTAEYWPRLSMTAEELKKRRVIHLDAIRARFPALEKLAIEYTWSGVVCVSSNLMPSFGRLSDNVYVSGGYNGSGVGGGTIRGSLIVDYAFDRDSELLEGCRYLPAPGLDTATSVSGPGGAMATQTRQRRPRPGSVGRYRLRASLTWWPPAELRPDRPTSRQRRLRRWRSAFPRFAPLA